MDIRIAETRIAGNRPSTIRHLRPAILPLRFEKDLSPDDWVIPPPEPNTPSDSVFRRAARICKAVLDKGAALAHLVVVIGSIRHKGLRDYWTRGRAKGLGKGWIRKLRRVMAALEAADRPEHMNSRIVLPSPEGRQGALLRLFA